MDCMANTVTNVMNTNVMNTNVMNINKLYDNSTVVDDTTVVEHFQHILTPLEQYGWQFVKCDSDSNNTIVMNKKCHELEEIAIEYKYNYYHFNLPIHNSIYSYYKKFTNVHDALEYLELYVDQFL